MSDKKITQLPTATTPVAGTEVLPFVQSGVTKQVSVANLTVGRAISALSYTATSADSIKLPATTANIDIGTAWGAHTIYFRAGGTTFFSISTSGNTICNTGGFVSGLSAAASFGSNNNYDVNLIRNNSPVASLVSNGIAFPANNGLNFGSSVLWRTGAGTPEGAIAAAVGSLYTNTTGGAGTTLYVKESGVGSTGWVAK